ncbi:cytochrome P450 4d1-like [Toxorhynchites rutilus septentrionalis]|uniref:cytochrome P450 4d1-like n=1 Tax=Toxorhynchites rutilus septentrionalis TaxID=329112 RepID=UPI0024792611|nr:cytochrome P450 4d1-like [Toxorhynchites rutilus septentrionalis]
MWALLVLLTAVIVVLAVYRKFARTLDVSKQYGGPRALPILGNGLWFLNKTPVEMLQIVERLIAEYGTVFRFWQGPEFTVYVGDASMVENILTNRNLTDKSGEYKFLSDWLGDGLLLSKRQKWHARRKAITPAFHFKILEQFVEVFDRNASELVDVLSTYADSEAVFDVFPFVLLYTLDVICESAMGTSVKALRNADSEYVQAVKEAANISIRRMFDFIRRTPMFYLTPSYAKFRKNLKILHGYTDNVIISRRKQLEDGGQDNSRLEANDENEFGVKKREAFLDLLIKTKINDKVLANLEIREEVDTFMFEGHDTTTSAVAFTLYNLAKYPTVQQKAYEEVISVVGENSAKPVDLSHLHDLTYLDMVIKETLRLYPSVPLIGRRCVEEVTIDGKTIPAGANIIIGIYFMGRDPQYFENPLDFRPERFEGETSVEKFNPYKYVPFSAGPRNCIGQKFAINEMKSVISKLLRHYKFILPPNLEEPILMSELILKPERGIQLQIKRR